MLVKRATPPIFNWFTALPQPIVPVGHKISWDLVIREAEAHDDDQKWLRHTYQTQTKTHILICLYMRYKFYNSHSHTPSYRVASSERNRRAGDKIDPEFSLLELSLVGWIHHTPPLQPHHLIITNYRTSHCKTQNIVAWWLMLQHTLPKAKPGCALFSLPQQVLSTSRAFALAGSRHPSTRRSNRKKLTSFFSRT